MKTLSCVFTLALLMLSPSPTDKMSANDLVRVREFYRLADRIQDHVWPGWSSTPAPLLLVAQQKEFLTRFDGKPEGFADAGDGFLVRPRQFTPNLQATFPAFGPPSVIVIGTPKTTASGASTPWLFIVMHEHFHQLQDGQPDFFKKQEALGLNHGDTSGMWMLNFPFPYEKPETVKSYSALRDLLLRTGREKDQGKFKALTKQYAQQRKAFFAQFSPEERRYFEFELWKEGIARYTQVKCAEAAAGYQPTEEFGALPDYESFAQYASRAREDTLTELASIKIEESRREVVYSFGAAEGFLLDRLRPDWKKQYFEHPFSLEESFSAN